MLFSFPCCCLIKDSHAACDASVQAAVLNAKGENPTGKVRPSVLALSRQGMPNLPSTSKEGAMKGGYIVHGGDAKPDVIFLASGAPASAPPDTYHASLIGTLAGALIAFHACNLFNRRQFESCRPD